MEVGMSGDRSDREIDSRRRNLLLGGAALSVLGTTGLSISTQVAQAQQQQTPRTGSRRPNILVIFGDDIGLWNLSVWNKGMMGFRTPNIDRIANEGAIFSTYYGQQSCTAGRAAFITGQCPFRTGLTKVGLPGATVGLQKEDPTIAEMLKPLGYMCGQFGKNHLGDRDEFLPTAHGFDEFFGNLYHLNAEEEPENPDYPKDPEFRKKYGPRGVLKTSADGKIDDTGPLTRKRMETVDEEFLAAAKDFMGRQVKADKPFFVWFNSTRMHIYTHLKPSSAGKTGLGLQADGMVEHDGQVGELLKFLEDEKIADNTLVIYSTDNGAMKNQWPDGGASPFRSEKDTNWEGAVRVPCVARWPGVIKPGTILDGLFSAEDWLPTLVAAAGGDPDIKGKLLKGLQVGSKTFKVHLDGYNQLPVLKGETTASPRKDFFYFSDDGELMAFRDERYKYNFVAQFATGMNVWKLPPTNMRIPIITDLMSDPFEYAWDASVSYENWLAARAFLLLPAVDKVARYMATYKEFPPRQRAASFSIDQVMEKVNASIKAR
jgi:arylsulfatase A-like enzyme